jgi:hypothetical protein
MASESVPVKVPFPGRRLLDAAWHSEALFRAAAQIRFSLAHTTQLDGGGEGGIDDLDDDLHEFALGPADAVELDGRSEAPEEKTRVLAANHVPRGGPPLLCVGVDPEDCVCEVGYDGGGYCEVYFTVGLPEPKMRRGWQRLYLDARRAARRKRGARDAEDMDPFDVSEFSSSEVAAEVDARRQSLDDFTLLSSDDDDFEKVDTRDVAEDVEVVARVDFSETRPQPLFHGWSCQVTDADGNVGSSLEGYFEAVFQRQREATGLVPIKAASKVG